jgi:hypothetical protein
MHDIAMKQIQNEASALRELHITNQDHKTSSAVVLI